MRIIITGFHQLKIGPHTWMLYTDVISTFIFHFVKPRPETKSEVLFILLTGYFNNRKTLPMRTEVTAKKIPLKFKGYPLLFSYTALTDLLFCLPMKKISFLYKSKSKIFCA